MSESLDRYLTTPPEKQLEVNEDDYEPYATPDGDVSERPIEEQILIALQDTVNHLHDLNGVMRDIRMDIQSIRNSVERA